LLATALGGCGKARHETPAQRRARERATIERIRVQVAQVRGLKWKARLDVRILSKDELRRQLQRTEARDARPERDRSDEAILKLLKLIPADLDLQARLRAAFDPDGVANPHKVLPAGSRCADVQAIPAGAWI